MKNVTDKKKQKNRWQDATRSGVDFRLPILPRFYMHATFYVVLCLSDKLLVFKKCPSCVELPVDGVGNFLKVDDK